MYLAIPIIEMVFCLALLVVLMVSGKKHIARRPFALFLVFMTMWGFFIFMMRSASDLDIALVWEQFVFLAIVRNLTFRMDYTLLTAVGEP